MHTAVTRIINLSRRIFLGNTLDVQLEDIEANLAHTSKKVARLSEKRRAAYQSGNRAKIARLNLQMHGLMVYRNELQAARTQIRMLRNFQSGYVSLEILLMHATAALCGAAFWLAHEIGTGNWDKVRAWVGF